MIERVGLAWIAVFIAWAAYALLSIIHLLARRPRAFFEHMDIACGMAVTLLGLWVLFHG